MERISGIEWIVAVGFLFLCNTLLNGQRCYSGEWLKEKVASSSIVAEKRAEIETYTQNYIRNYENRVEAREVLRIPVVVHVVWRLAAQNISDAQIQSQIDVLNQDFRKLNSDVSAVPLLFQADLADLELEFYLAETDPEGVPTNGITRTQTVLSNLGDLFIGGQRSICHTFLGGQDAWCPEHYLNIWVGELSAGLAVTSFPGTDEPEEDGIRIESDVFGTIGTVSPPYHLGRTLTHEIGHYFNLLHLWGEELSCDSDDGLSDTPLQSDWYLNTCPTTPQFSCGSPDMYMNYMNFTDDSCIYMFSKGQKARVWAAISGPRSGLLNAADCGAVPIHELTVSSLKIFPNPASERLWIDGPSGQKGELVLLDVNGKKLQNWSFDGHFPKEIMLENWTNGIYFLIFTFNKQYLSSKLVLHH